MAITKRVRKRDGVATYYVDFRDQRGRRVREVAGTTRTQARRLLERRLGEVRAGTYVHPRDVDADAGPTFSEFANRFMKDYGDQRRSDHYAQNVRVLVRYFKAQRVREVSRADIDRFRAWRSRQVGPSTLRKNLTVLGTMLRKAVDWEVIPASPAVGVEKPPEPSGRVRYLSRQEWTDLLEASPPWLRPILTMGLAQGLRLKEVVSLRWEDIDQEARLLYVSVDTKSGRPDPVPLSGAAVAVLEQQDSIRRDLGRQLSRVIAWVFVDAEGGNLTSEVARNRISKTTIKVLRGLGMNDASFHTLRHTTASWMVQRGRPLAEVQQFLRHRSIQTTLRYAHLKPHHLRDTVSALDSVLGVDTQMDTQTKTGVQPRRSAAVNPASSTTCR